MGNIFFFIKRYHLRAAILVCYQQSYSFWIAFTNKDSNSFGERLRINAANTFRESYHQRQQQYRVLPLVSNSFREHLLAQTSAILQRSFHFTLKLILNSSSIRFPGEYHEIALLPIDCHFLPQQVF